LQQAEQQKVKGNTHYRICLISFDLGIEIAVDPRKPLRSMAYRNRQRGMILGSDMCATLSPETPGACSLCQSSTLQQSE
jgi:hypothetical protein